MDDRDEEPEKRAFWPAHIFPSEFLQIPQLAKLRPASTNFLSPLSLSVSSFQGTPRSNTRAENKITGIHTLENAELANASRPLHLSVSTAVAESRRSPFKIEKNTSSASSSAPSPGKPQMTQPTSLRTIMATIWPTLSWHERTYFLLGFFTAFIIGAFIPAFVFIFVKLLRVYYLQVARAAQAKTWALALLAIACVDGLATFCMQYALEHSGQAWVDSLRVQAFKRILAQPRSWFDVEANSAARLNETLDGNAEDMRNLWFEPQYNFFLTLVVYGKRSATAWLPIPGTSSPKPFARSELSVL